MKDEDIKKNDIVRKNSRKEFIIKYIVSIVLRVIAMITPILFSFAVDNATDGVYGKAYIFILISIGMVILSRSFDVLNTYTWHKLYNKLYNGYTDLALQSTYDNSIFSLSRISTSEFINILNSDINIMTDFYCNFVIRSVRVIEFFVIIVYFFMINLLIGFAGVAVSLIALSVLYFSRNTIEKVNKKKSYELDKKTNVITEIFICMKEIKNFNIFEQIKKRGNNYTENYTASVLKQRIIEDGYKFSIILLIDIFRLSLFLYGIYLISKGNMTIGTLLIIYNYYAQLIESFSEFATFNTNYRQFKVARTRYNKLLEYSRKVNNVSKLGDGELKGNIEFKNVLYGYREDPTLDNVSFKINNNSINIITGNERSGKTGIFDLIMKLNRQHEGDILIDNIDIEEFDSDYYFNNVSLVTKEPSFFNMSIRENLSMIKGDFNKIVRICKELGIHEDIIKLKDGYDTTLNLSADNINSSLKHLLGIARVLIKTPKIMLFDETFTTFDKTSKNKLINILEKYKKDHTIIIISKDVEFFEIADNIIVMDKNKKIDSGNHKKLIKESNIYKKIASN